MTKRPQSWRERYAAPPDEPKLRSSSWRTRYSSSATFTEPEFYFSRRARVKRVASRGLSLAKRRAGPALSKAGRVTVSGSGKLRTVRVKVSRKRTGSVLRAVDFVLYGGRREPAKRRHLK